MRCKIFTILLVCAAVGLLAATANARAWISDLTAEELQQRLNQPRKVVVVDTRTEQEYRQGHISGAINIPSSQFEQIAAHLPDNLETPVVFYCRGFD